MQHRDPTTIQAEADLARERFSEVTDELGNHVEQKKRAAKQKFSPKRFVKEHPVAIGLGAAAVVGGGILAYVAIRNSLPVRGYLTYRALKTGIAGVIGGAAAYAQAAASGAEGSAEGIAEVAGNAAESIAVAAGNAAEGMASITEHGLAESAQDIGMLAGSAFESARAALSR